MTSDRSTAPAASRTNGAARILEAHPLANLFPMMAGKPMAELVSSIKTEGLQQPIVRIRDLILDGRCRYEACRIAGVEPHYIDYDEADDPASLARFVLAANVHRRHMDAIKLAKIAGKLIEESRKGPRGPAAPITIAEAARTVGASVRSTKRAARVLENSPLQIVAAVEKNEVTLTDADSVASAPADQQLAALKKKRAGKAKSLKAAISCGTTFDPVELDSAPATATRKSANGAPYVSTKQRKECNDLLGKLCRSLLKVGIYDEFVESLSQIAERLKQL